jgi:hypothetical protein
MISTHFCFVDDWVTGLEQSLCVHSDRRQLFTKKIARPSKRVHRADELRTRYGRCECVVMVVVVVVVGGGGGGGGGGGWRWWWRVVGC